jgi:hypothetical protein
MACRAMNSSWRQANRADHLIACGDAGAAAQPGWPCNSISSCIGRFDIVPAINASNPTHSIAVPDPPARAD